MVLALAQRTVQTADALIAGATLGLHAERGGMIGLLFHALFRDQREIDHNDIDPLQRTTVDQLRFVIQYYLECGYQFIGPDDLLRGLDPAGRYVQLTFDDGYYNNSLALPVLEEYQVPAVFFISTDNVMQNKCFWWDVLHRERLATGASRRQIYQDGVRLKRLRTEHIEEQLILQFGKKCLQPRGDIDRPFTPAELRDFARSPRAIIGNHTANHAILTHYENDALDAQLSLAQDAIHEMTGCRPVAIAYPNGGHDDRVIEACKRAGLKLGYTVEPQKIPTNTTDYFHMGRFAPNGLQDIRTQCRTYRSEVSLYRTCRRVYLDLFR